MTQKSTFCGKQNLAPLFKMKDLGMDPKFKKSPNK